MAGNFIEVITPTDTFRLEGRPCEISAFSFVPTRRKCPPERTYFNTPAFLLNDNNNNKEKIPNIYDRIFYAHEGFNQKLHRDDREHAKLLGLDIYTEEKQKKIPSLASTDYGHRLNHKLEKRDVAHVRVGHVQSEFYRRNMF